MSKSETALLRKKLAKVVAENGDWQMRVARFEAAFAKREEMFEAEIDRLRLEIAERDRRLVRYGNPNASWRPGRGGSCLGWITRSWHGRRALKGNWLQCNTCRRSGNEQCRGV